MAFAIITAGGKGERFKSAIPKQLHNLKGKPVLYWSVAAFRSVESFKSIIVTFPAEDSIVPYREAMEKCGIEGISFVAGGRTRADSVRNGVMSLHMMDEEEVVLIHDAARPIISTNLIEEVLSDAHSTGAAIAALPIRDTIKEVKKGSISKTVPRGGLYAAQTPQGFRLGILRNSYQLNPDISAMTDESMLVEAAGYPVAIVPGDARNIKITTAEDLELARHYLKS